MFTINIDTIKAHLKNRVNEIDWDKYLIFIKQDENNYYPTIKITEKRYIWKWLYEYPKKRKMIDKIVETSHYDPLVVCITRVKLFRKSTLISVNNLSNLTNDNCYRKNVINI